MFLLNRSFLINYDKIVIFCYKICNVVFVTILCSFPMCQTHVLIIFPSDILMPLNPVDSHGVSLPENNPQINTL